MREFDGYDKMIHGWIQEAVAENQPRQATVVRSEGAHVFVRFIGEGPDAPEAKLPSSIADLPAGTSGWVHPLAGGKGRFIATAVRIPKTLNTSGGTNINRSTAGTSVAEAQTLTFSGLAPGHLYTVSWTVIARYASGGSGLSRITAQVSGATTVTPSVPYVVHGAANEQNVGIGQASVQPDADGVITVAPAFIWNSGSIRIDGTHITATVS